MERRRKRLVVGPTKAQTLEAGRSLRTEAARERGYSTGVPASKTKPRKVLTKQEMRAIAKTSGLKVSKDVAEFFRDESNVQNQAKERFLGLVRMVNRLGVGKKGRLSSAPKIIKMHHKDSYFSACGLASNPRKDKPTRVKRVMTAAQQSALASAREELRTRRGFGPSKASKEVTTRYIAAKKARQGGRIRVRVQSQEGEIPLV